MVTTPVVGCQWENRRFGVVLSVAKDLRGMEGPLLPARSFGVPQNDGCTGGARGGEGYLDFRPVSDGRTSPSILIRSCSCGLISMIRGAAPKFWVQWLCQRPTPRAF